MKKFRYLIILLIMILIPFKVYAAGSISVSPRTISIDQGSTATFTITANNAAGRVDISSTNPSVASINKSSEFLDNSSVTVTVSGVSVGTATINVALTDVTTYDDETLTNTYSVNVTVNQKTTTTTTTKVVTTKPTVTGGAGNVVTQPTTQYVETTTISSLYFTSLTVDEYEVKEEDGVYYVTTDPNRASVEINATAPDGVTITGTGKRNLAIGKNTVSLVLTDSEGRGKNVELIITRPDVGDKNTLLKELEVVNYRFNFDPKTKEYTIDVPYNTKEIYVKAVAQSDDTSIKGDGKYVITGNDNNIFVTVSYGDVASSTYVIHIKKSYLGLLPIIILTIGLIGMTGGVFFLSNKLKETKEALSNNKIAEQASIARSIEEQGPQLSINGESATGIGARVVKPQAVQPAQVKIVESRPTTTVGMVPPSDINKPDINGVNPQVKIVKKVVVSSQGNEAIEQPETNTSEVL